MNAAARHLHQNTLFSGRIGGLRLSKQLMLPFILLLAVLASALAVVYSTNEDRVTFAELQQAEHREHELQLRWGQLLLEQASLSTPGRVQTLAAEQLKMVLPVNNQTVLLPL